MLKKTGIILLIGVVLFTGSSCTQKKEVSLKQSLVETLKVLDSTLLASQASDTANQDFGAIWCNHCKLYHTRGAEAVYPFAYHYSVTSDQKYRLAAINLGNWLIKQQFEDGSWKETPEEWTGTTTDQLLMMALAFPILQEFLSVPEKEFWINSISMAGDYLVKEMNPEFASINYVATTTASLMVLNSIVPNRKYTDKAKILAHQVIAKMDDDHFITGEGGRVFDAKYGVDLTYNMEMSLWGLALYAKLADDDKVLDKVIKASKKHLSFVYPDGSLDGSWGIRSNKWTCFGGATSDGTQVLFSLLAEYDDRFATASLRNLNFLQTCMHEGLIGYGPSHWEVMTEKPCIYPTFAKAKNLAMAHAYLKRDTDYFPNIPSDVIGMTLFPTLNIATFRTANFYATVTAYGYKDPKGAKSKYMYRPTGGAISNLWLKDYGFLQASSQTEYHRWEPMHFPEAENLKSLTPRIEFTDTNGYFTNLYEFDAIANFSARENTFLASIYGELKNKNQEPGGIGYTYEYKFAEASITKKIHIRYHSLTDTIRIIEPIIQYQNTEITKIDSKKVSIAKGNQMVYFEIMEGDVEITMGEDANNYWSPYPALKAYPIVLTVLPISGEIEQEITYRFKIK